MPTYNNQTFRSLPQQVQKNKEDIANLFLTQEEGGVGPQGPTGPRGPQGIQGNVGPAGPDGTPVAGESIDAVLNGGTGNYELNLLSIPNGTYRFIFRQTGFSSTLASNGLTIVIDGVTQTKKVSILDFILFEISTSSNYVKWLFYDESGEATYNEFLTLPTTMILVGTTIAFSIEEIVEGSTVGPTGPAGAQGDQGEDGPQGPQGIQGLPGEQNLLFLAEYEDTDTFPEYAYRVMVQIVGGDYDGMTFIKETLEEGASCKFGPYATLLTIEDNGGTIQAILQNGVTSVRIYKVENLT